MVMLQELTLAQKIRRARERKAWTQTTLADKLGVSYLTVGTWEAGTSRPRVSLRAKLWALLDLTPEDFDPPPDGGRKGRESRHSSQTKGDAAPIHASRELEAFTAFVGDATRIIELLPRDKWGVLMALLFTGMSLVGVAMGATIDPQTALQARAWREEMEAKLTAAGADQGVVLQFRRAFDDFEERVAA